MRDVIEYITDEKKTKPWLIGTLNCSAETAYDEMVLVKEMFYKASEDKSNRMCIHFSQNLVAGETTPDIAKEIADRLVKHPMFRGFQVIYATHLDTGKLHTHFVVNSVNMEDGHKWEMSPKMLQELKDYSDELLREYNLYIVPVKNRENQKNNQTRYERKLEAEGKSWKHETYLAVKSCMEVARSREHFIELMKQQGYDVNWTDDRKWITFTDPDGHKLRNRKLYPAEKFTKEAMEKRFAANQQYYELQKQQEQEEILDTGMGLLKLASQLRREKGAQYPFSKMEKDYNSVAAKKERALEAQKGRGLDWER